MPTPSYWCYRCTRLVRVTDQNAVVCPDCAGGFIEAVEANPPPENSRRFPAAAMYMLNGNDRSDLRFRRRNRRNNTGEWSPFNPVIVLRTDVVSGTGDRGFELYYEDGAGNGLQPLPEMLSELLIESGFDRLLEQLSQIDISGLNRSEQPPASKSAVESMPTIEVSNTHVNKDSHCAICIEAFTLGMRAREMPCKHIYHSDCIVPWLNMRNSCPVCRYKLPTDSTNLLTDSTELGFNNNNNTNTNNINNNNNNNNNTNNNNSIERSETTNGEETQAIGLTIWRLPGGGFAVGRFTGRRRNNSGDRELPVMYTEPDGGDGEGSGTPRRIVWETRRRPARGIQRAFRNMFSFFGRWRSNSLENGGGSMNRSWSLSSSIFSRMSSRRNRNWIFEEQNGMPRW